MNQEQAELFVEFVLKYVMKNGDSVESAQAQRLLHAIQEDQKPMLPVSCTHTRGTAENIPGGVIMIPADLPVNLPVNPPADSPADPPANPPADPPADLPANPNETDCASLEETD